MKQKHKLLILGVALSLLIGASFYPFFEDPFHEKTEMICFWEWIARNIYKTMRGEP